MTKEFVTDLRPSWWWLQFLFWMWRRLD